ncbi:MAG: RagB/SusD family nutrient uptake outer membrane protein [Chitinophagaceae bacterium]|nr:RagB/SusD family nutrient uptake outer membrane protein [Chitinophagaceae bacterium]
MKKISLIIAGFAFLTITGCKKEYLETVPSDGVTEAQIFSKYSSVSAALTGIYKELFAFGINAGGHDDYGQKSLDLMFDLMGNDMVVHSQGYGWYNADYSYTAWLSATDGSQSMNAWRRYYDQISQANKIIANVDGVSDASQAQKESIKGQALALRAYSYYYLANYFQQTFKGNESAKGVPIYLPGATEGGARGTLQQVYDQIEADFKDAATLLTGKPRVSKVNIDISVIRGFQARIALLKNDWPAAATFADQAIQGGYPLMNAATYLSRTSFSTIGNSECMWGSQIPESEATIYASFFSHMDIATGGYAALGGQKKITKWLYDQIPNGDVRKQAFTTPGTGTDANPDYNQQKFRVPTPGSWAADYQYMNVPEMYLIKAEGLARQTGKEAEAIAALETLVKARYPGYSAAGLSGQALIDEILLQRRIELWGEGLALWDIKRLNQGLNRPQGPGNHGAPNYNPGVYTTSPADPRFLMRIPQKELDNNTNMTPDDQNPQ